MTNAEKILNLQDSTSTSTTSMTRKKTINIRDLFVEPNFHELEVVDDDDNDGIHDEKMTKLLRP